MTTDRFTVIIMAHIRANGLEGDFVAGKIIEERISKKHHYRMGLAQYHELVDNIIQDYKKEQKREEFKDDFHGLLKD